MMEECQQSTSSAGSKPMACPVPNRKYKIEDMGFMKNQSIQFYSENIHMASKFKNKRTMGLVQTDEDAESANSKMKKKLEKMNQMRNKFGIKFKTKKEGEVVGSNQQGQNEESGLTLDIQEGSDGKDKNIDLRETKGSSKELSKDLNKKDAIVEQEGEEDGSSIDRCSNPVSVNLEEAADFQFDGSISEEDDDEGSHDSFKF